MDKMHNIDTVSQLCMFCKQIRQIIVFTAVINKV